MFCVPILTSNNNFKAYATDTNQEYYTGSFSQAFTEEDLIGLTISVEYTEKGTAIIGDKPINVSFKVEQNEETIKKYHKYVKKKIDSADIGILFYPETTFDGQTTNLPNANYKYKVTLPKNLRNKELAVIPFTNYRTTATTQAVTINKSDGSITFNGSENIHAFAIVYNGVYKDLILIGIILLTLLIVCVTVKIYAVRKDNPAVLDKKNEKGKKQAKEAHKQNRKLAQALKRQKEKEKQEKNKH